MPSFPIHCCFLIFDEKGKIIAPLGHHSTKTNCHDNTKFSPHIQNSNESLVSSFWLFWISHFISILKETKKEDTVKLTPLTTTMHYQPKNDEPSDTIVHKKLRLYESQISHEADQSYNKLSFISIIFCFDWGFFLCNAFDLKRRRSRKNRNKGIKNQQQIIAF